MAITLFERGAAEEKKQEGVGTSIVTGVVINDCDLVMQGKVLVRIPSLDKEVWARLAGPGGGSGAGFFYSPRADDEVLIGLTQNDPVDAFVIAGLWGTLDRPPITTPVDVQTKRVLKTGLKGGVGHEVEFDDLQQKITIMSSTRQKIAIEPTKIEISNTTGTLKLTLNNLTQTLTIEGINVELKGAATLKLTAPLITIEGKAPGGGPGAVSVQAGAACLIKGKPVLINPPGT